MFVILPIVLCLVQTPELASAELFTSNAHLQTALYAERDISSLLKLYVEKEEARISKIKQLAEDFDRHSKRALEDVDKYLGNPVNAFLLIKKFTLDWDRNVTPVLSNNTLDSLMEEIEQVKSDLPTFEDLKGAASALMRLQDTYHLDTSAVAHGELGGVASPILSAEECFELGRLSYNEGDFYHTMLWMSQALDHVSFEQADGKLRIESQETEGLAGDLESARVEVLDYLAFSYFKLGDISQALVLTNELLAIDPGHERAANNKKYFEAMLQDETRNKRSVDKNKPGYHIIRDEYRNSEEFLTYEALCRGENVVPIQNADRLTCQYRTNNHPLLLLQPAKEETVHLDPWVVIYHDVLSDEEIRTIKHLATPRLNRATVQNSKTGELEFANYRISKSAWLKGDEHPVIQKVNNRMEAITGLEMSTAEELQIANYGLGGHYEPHFDFARRKKKSALEEANGNRIATFLNYMSDVEAGGATVFPYIGLKLFPKKGNAAFWFNLRKNGEGIYNTRHAACPVLVGTKWVANKWIHERGQEFRRPCSLTEDE
ncbi:prolyl 4-hydroxylase subunit alpha-2-like isoform X2 [Physella acuta]|uniref:prolyl 4-hydroxylase subunit alpha-2-like isoform X2 n=1 Tax=Physella acuta TaxID=109671 RepID=UPI0027DCDD79|nr:prolyl 4-hydroxylase subunit alpha-2-like isoform X2 [Physella acuta]